MVDRFEGGAGQRIYKLIQPSTGIIYYRHRYYVDDQKAGFSRTDPTTWSILNPLEATPKTQNASFYAQDSYKVISNLSINYGIRWERQHVLGRDADAGFALNHNWAPRVGVVWDPTDTGKAKIYANWGRFYENIPQDINIRAFGGETQAFAYNFSPDASNTTPLNTTPSKSSLLGGSAEPVDPDLKGQYIDEYMVGGEYEVMPDSTLSIRFIHRNLGRVIEDFLVPSSGEYFIANPGQGTLGQSLGFYDGVTTAPAPAAQRKNTSVELTLRKRFSKNWQGMASYVYSKLEGNYDGTFQNSTGQLDPNINSAFDYADFMVNALWSAEQPAQEPAEVRRQLRDFQRSARRPELRRRAPLVLRSPADGLRLLVRLCQLGVLPDAARLARLRAVGLGSGSARRLPAEDRRRHEGEHPAGRLQPVQPSGRDDPRSALQPDVGRRVRRDPERALQRRRRSSRAAELDEPQGRHRQPAGDGDQSRLPEVERVGTQFTLPRSLRIGVRLTF